MMLLLMAGALHRAKLRKSPVLGQNSAKRSGISRNVRAGHLNETGVPFLPFDPHPVAIEELDPGLLQSLLDRRARDAQGISAPAFEPANCFQGHAGFHRELVLSPIEQGPGRAALGRRNLHKKDSEMRRFETQRGLGDIALFRRIWDSIIPYG